MCESAAGAGQTGEKTEYAELYLSNQKPVKAKYGCNGKNDPEIRHSGSFE